MIAIPRHGMPPARAADAGARCPVAGSWWVSLGVSIAKSLRYAAGGHIGRPGDSVAPPRARRRAGRARRSPVRRSQRLIRPAESANLTARSRCSRPFHIQTGPQRPVARPERRARPACAAAPRCPRGVLARSRCGQASTRRASWPWSRSCPRSVTGLTLDGWPGGLGEALVRFDVTLAGGLDDVRRDGRPGGGPVPLDGPGPVADDLLVEGVLRPPRLPRLG